jgi:hypothetical protein
MWSGGLPEAGYDSVALTVEGGRLVGWFGESGGMRYRISAGPGGGGRMAMRRGLPGQEPSAFCAAGVDAVEETLRRPLLPAEAMAADLPARAVAAQNHEQLDVLVVYTEPAERNWSNQGVDSHAAIRSAGDYLNMVLRNGGVELKFAHEIGHGLGAHHDPVNGGSPRFAVRPYAFGHGNLDRIPNAGTIMSYTGQGEPYLSSVRVEPQGRVIGILNERENERALRETIHLGVQYGDFVSPLPASAPAAAFRVERTLEQAGQRRRTRFG